VRDDRSQHGGWARGGGDHYDELDAFYRELWGDHVHHGLWRTGREPAAVAVVQLVDLVAERLGLRAGERVVDIGAATARRPATSRPATARASPRSR
jgi:tocopherol O-methyltransferase